MVRQDFVQFLRILLVVNAISLQVRSHPRIRKTLFESGVTAQGVKTFVDIRRRPPTLYHTISRQFLGKVDRKCIAPPTI